MNKTEIKRNNLALCIVAMGLVTRPEEPEFMAPTDGHLFDINKNSRPEITKVVLEELKTRELTKRVTNSEPVRRKEIRFSEYNVHARAEWQATQNAFVLAKECNLEFWISAEDGAMGLTEEQMKATGKVYPDGRFNIYFRTVDENGEIVLRGKHLPLEIDRFKSLDLGKRLIKYGGKTLGKVEDVEDLRVQPIGFVLKDEKEWINECRKMMPELEEFWVMFENGDDVKQEQEMAVVVEEAMIIAKGNNVIFQRELQRRGVEINTSGNHGIGYLGKHNQGIYNYKIEMRNGIFFTEPVRDTKGDLICPVCGVEINEGRSVCPKCGINLKESASLN